MDLSSSFYREPLPPEHLVNCGDVPVHLRYRTKPDLTQGQHQRLRREWLVSAFSLHRSSYGLQVGLHC